MSIPPRSEDKSSRTSINSADYLFPGSLEKTCSDKLNNRLSQNVSLLKKACCFGLPVSHMMKIMNSWQFKEKWQADSL